MTTMNSNERDERLKQRRSKRLAKISEAVEALENSIIEPRKSEVSIGSRNEEFRHLYYLARLAKKAK